jgi:hypothetical protein
MGSRLLHLIVEVSVIEMEIAAVCNRTLRRHFVLRSSDNHSLSRVPLVSSALILFPSQRHEELAMRAIGVKYIRAVAQTFFL